MPEPIQQKLNPPYAVVVMVAVMALFFAPQIIGFAIYSNHVDSASLKWPKTSGKIILYDKTYHGGKHPGYNYTATYAYIVNGTHYRGQRFAVWSDSVGYDGELDYRVAHPVSSSVDVYYDPKHPESAVLVPGPSLANRNMIYLGSALIPVGIVLLIMARKIPHYAAT